MLSIRTLRGIVCGWGLLLMGCTEPTSEENLGVSRLADELDTEDAQVVWDTLPTEMHCGETKQVAVNMLNIGDVPWEPGYHFLRAWQGLGPFEAPLQIDVGGTIDPGYERVFSFALRAPSYPVVGAKSRWRMYRPGHWFGNIAPEDPDQTISVTCPEPDDRATLVNTAFPSNVGCGETFDASIELENSGLSAWTPGAYRLEHGDDPFEGPARIDLDEDVYQGGHHIFSMTLTAPPGPVDNAHATWRMVSDQSGPFGPTVNLPINVSCEPLYDAVEISHNLPASVPCGTHFTSQITVYNVGSTTWSSSGGGSHGYYLGVPDDAVVLGEPRYYFPPGVSIGRNQSYTFNVTLHGPPNHDRYYVAFQMYNVDRQEWFGERAWQNMWATCQAENARVDGYSLDTQVTCGRPYRVEVTMQNTGTLPWSRDSQHRLKNTTNLPFHPWTPYIEIEPNVVVLPGHTYQFVALLTAPYYDETFFHGWQMASWTGATFGDPMIRYVEVQCEEDVSELTDAHLPTELSCGQVFPASITLKNQGRALWATAAGYKLGAAGGSDPFGPPEVLMQGAPFVYPGSSKTFTFNLVGPHVPPFNAPTDWTMRHGNTEFGEVASSNVQLNCQPLNARLVAIASAEVENCDPEVDLFVSVRNTGFKTWGASFGVQPDKFSLVQTGRGSPYALIDPVPLPEGVKVPPGKVYTFRARFRRADADGARVPSWWRMKIERPGGGDRLDDLASSSLFGQTMRIAVPRVCQSTSDL